MTPDPRSDRSKRIAGLNDRFRETFQGGTVLATAGVRGHGEAFLNRAFHALHHFNDFTNGNDPYGEHDFGAFTLDGSVASLAKGRCVIRGLPVHLMTLRWPNGPDCVKMSENRSKCDFSPLVEFSVLMKSMT